jgi:hypothetical protein
MEIKNIILLIIFVMAIVFVQFAQAKSADDIIDKYIEIRGGKQKLNAIKSIYMEGVREIMGIKVLIKVTVVQNKIFRTDFNLEDRSGYIIVTPTYGWSLIPQRSQKVNAIPPNILWGLQQHLDIAGPVVDYSAKKSKAELQGKEIIDGNQSYKIKLTLADSIYIICYFDAETGLLIQTNQIALNTMDGNAEPAEIITSYGDYTSIDGILFPQTIINPQEGINGGSTTFYQIELNKEISYDQYNPA